MKAKINWVENYLLEGNSDSGKKFYMNTGEGVSEFSPAELVLQALAGCTMMDCVLIISKSRRKVEKFWVDVEAEESEIYPKVFTKIHLTYNFVGGELDNSLVERAIKLSEEKYCRVHAMLQGSVTITSSYKLNQP